MADLKISNLPVNSTMAASDIIPFARVSTSITTGTTLLAFESVLADNFTLTGVTAMQRASINSASIAFGTLTRPTISSPSITGTTEHSGAIIVTGGNMLVVGASSALGYGDGAGGTVTQSVGGAKSLSVSLNRATGKIIMSNSVMAASTITSMLFGNSVLGVTDLLMLQYMGNGLAGTSKREYSLSASIVAPGAAAIQVKSLNNFADASSIFVGFAVIKGTIT